MFALPLEAPAPSAAQAPTVAAKRRKKLRLSVSTLVPCFKFDSS
jgi:hypothetical protein